MRHSPFCWKTRPCFSTTHQYPKYFTRLLGYVANLQSKYCISPCAQTFVPYVSVFALLFSSYLPDQESTIYNLLSIFSFPPHITAVFIQNASKIMSKMAANPETDDRQFITLCTEIEEMLLPCLKSQNLEIQERATSLSQIILIF